MTNTFGQFFPPKGEGEKPPQNIELVVARQEQSIQERQAEVRAALLKAEQERQPTKFRHIPTGLELK